MSLKLKTPTRKTPKPNRTMDWDGQLSVLVIRQGKAESLYTVEHVRTPTGHAFTLTKDAATFLADMGGDPSHAVEVSGDTGAKRCSCRGFTFRGHCRHADAMATLVARGHFEGGE